MIIRTKTIEIGGNVQAITIDKRILYDGRRWSLLNEKRDVLPTIYVFMGGANVIELNDTWIEFVESGKYQVEFEWKDGEVKMQRRDLE